MNENFSALSLLLCLIFSALWKSLPQKSQRGIQLTLSIENVDKASGIEKMKALDGGIHIERRQHCQPWRDGKNGRFNNAGINLTGYHPPGLTPGPLIFSVKIPAPGTAFQCKTPAPGSRKLHKIPTPA